MPLDFEVEMQQFAVIKVIGIGGVETTPLTE